VPRVDLHSHLLPGIDDGPADASGAVALARSMAADGTGAVAATPHVRADHPGVVPSELAGRAADLRRALERAEVALDVVAGGEVDVLWSLRATPEELRDVSLGQRGRDLLVETPYGSLPPLFEDALFRLTAQGYRVLLAHPERSRDLRRRPARLAALVERGTLVQVTASSLADPHRRSPVRRYAAALVSEGLAHVIASDLHGPAAPGRAALSAGAEAAERLAPLRARWMTEEAPAAILAGEPLPAAPPLQPRGLRRLLRR
jgi:protein-tyrosine phosphatase